MNKEFTQGFKASKWRIYNVKLERLALESTLLNTVLRLCIILTIRIRLGINIKINFLLRKLY